MARIMIFYVPEDPALLAALGTLAIRHGHLEYTLRMARRSLRKISIPDAFKETEWWSVSRLRKEIVATARNLFGNGPEVEGIAEMLERARKLSVERNRLIHGTYAKWLDGEPRFRPEGLRWRRLPDAAEAIRTAEALRRLTDEINETRLKGWLSQALAAVFQRRADSRS